MLKILFYLRNGNGISLRFHEEVESQVSDDVKEVYKRFEDIKKRLRQPPKNNTILVFLAVDWMDLANILSIHDMLRGIRLILILPDHEENTISVGHELYPRFISFIDNDLSEVAAILHKMMGEIKSENYSSTGDGS